MKRATIVTLITALLLTVQPRAAQADLYDNPGRVILVTTVLGIALAAIVAVAVQPRHPKGASAKDIHARFDHWIGQDVNALIREWGSPSSTFATPDGRSMIYTYVYQGRTIVHAVGTTAIAQRDACRFDWTANQEQRIERYKWDGVCVLTPTPGR